MENFVYFLIGALLAIISLAIIKIDKNEPCAMDVYQGKTTLEYTVVNGIKTDSTVIWNKD